MTSTYNTCLLFEALLWRPLNKQTNYVRIIEWKIHNFLLFFKENFFCFEMSDVELSLLDLAYLEFGSLKWKGRRSQCFHCKGLCLFVCCFYFSTFRYCYRLHLRCRHCYRCCCCFLSTFLSLFLICFCTYFLFCLFSFIRSFFFLTKWFHVKNNVHSTYTPARINKHSSRLSNKNEKSQIERWRRWEPRWKWEEK